MIVSTLSIALLAALNDRPTHEEIMGWIDVETILLLFSMMILVAILTETGVFDHLAVYAYRVCRIKRVKLENPSDIMEFTRIDHKWSNLAAHSLPLHNYGFNLNVTR